MNSNLAAIEFQIASEVKVDFQGKATFSIRAVARLAGIQDSSLVRGFQGAAQNPTKLAQFLSTHGFEGAALERYSETGIPDLTAASIVEYYAFEADRYCTEQAKEVYRAFARIGMRAYAHKLTNWEASRVDDYKQALLEVLEVQLPAKPLPHQVRYHPRFWDALEKVYGLKKGQLACSNFIKWRIYRHFPQEVCDRLEAINPLLKDGKRQSKIHQHFDDKLLLLLQDWITQITLLLEYSDNKQEFKRKIAKIKPISFNQGNVTFLKGGN